MKHPLIQSYMVEVVMLVIILIILGIISGFTVSGAIKLRPLSTTQGKSTYQYTWISAVVGWLVIVMIIAIIVLCFVYSEKIDKTSNNMDFILYGLIVLVMVSFIVIAGLSFAAITRLNDSGELVSSNANYADYSKARMYLIGSGVGIIILIIIMIIVALILSYKKGYNKSIADHVIVEKQIIENNILNREGLILSNEGQISQTSYSVSNRTPLPPRPRPIITESVITRQPPLLIRQDTQPTSITTKTVTTRQDTQPTILSE
jgi:hypothetical protein